MKNALLQLLLAAAVAASPGCAREPEGVVLRFVDQPDNAGGWKEIIERFEATHSDIDVELVEGPSATDAREAMYSTAFAAGDSPYDLVYMDVVWVARFAANDWLMPLGDRFPEAERALFLPGDIEGSRWSGRTFRVPMRSDSGVLFYRTDLVEDAPKTFDDLAAAARALALPPDRAGLVFQGKQYEGLTCCFLEVLRGHGGDVLSESGEVLLERPEAVRALAWLSSLVGDGAPDAVTTFQEEEARHVFHEGRAVFLRSWPYVWTRSQAPGSPIAGRIAMAPLPHAPGFAPVPTLGGWGFGISRTARHPDAAWAFVQYATSEEGMKILHRRAGAVPARHALFRDAELLAENPHFADLYPILLSARPRPVHPRYAEISAALRAQVSAALVKSKTPEEALQDAAAEIRRILGS